MERRFAAILAASFGHSANGWMFSNSSGGWEYPVFWAVVIAALSLMGDGAYSAKAILTRNGY